MTTASTYTYFAEETSASVWNIGINSSGDLLFGNYTGGWTTFQATGLADSSWHFVRLTTTGSSTSLYIDGTLFGTNASGGGVEDEDIVEITNRIKNGAFQIAHLRITTGGTPPTTGIPSISSMNQAAGTGGTLAFYDALDDIAGTGTKTSDGGNVTITMAAATASVDSSATDSFIDTPTNYTAASGNNGGNYCTLNPLINVGKTLKQGNLVCSGATGRAAGTMYVSSGKWYFEFKAGSSYTMVGIESSTAPPNPAWPGDNDQQHAVYGSTNTIYTNNSSSTYPGFTTGDLVGVALDMDEGKLYYYKNGSALNSGVAAVTGLTGAWTATCRSGSGSFDGDTVFNFGQRPFVYPPGGTGAPSSDYKSWCTQNISAPTITKGSTYFDTFLYTGDAASSRNITLPLAADFLWMKKRGETGSHQLVDTVRGNNSVVHTNADIKAKNPQTEFAGGGISSLSGTTATLSSGTSNNNNLNADTITGVGWVWDAGTVANPVGDSWSPGASKYIGIKFATASGGTVVYGQTSGTDTVQVWTSSDNSSWTQQGGNLTLADGHTLTTTDQYVYIRNTSDATFSNWYAAASNGADGHYSSSTYPSGASWTGPAYTDHDFRAGGGTYNAVGSLNSSAYNQSQTWSGLWTGTAGYGSFANLHNANVDSDYVQTLNGTMTFSSALTITSLRIRLNRYGANATLSVNGTDVTSQLPAGGSGLQWVTITGFTSLSSIAVTGNDYSSNLIGLYAIEVNGALLIDSGVTVADVPAFASTVRANPTAGFSIVRYKSGGSGGRIATGLNATPDIVFIKPTSSDGDWFVYTDVIDGSLDYLKLNSTDAKNNSTWTKLLSLSNYITMEGSSAAINSSGVTYSAYCFTSVAGYSKISTYTANALTNGPFVFTGFRPRWIMIKAAINSGDANYASWLIVDTERDTYNVSDAGLFANKSAGEGTRGDGAGTAGTWLDILSNGFKIRYAGTEVNGVSGEKYLYMAFAENPFSLNGGLAR